MIRYPGHELTALWDSAKASMRLADKSLANTPSAFNLHIITLQITNAKPSVRTPTIMPERQFGKVKEFNNEKGFGFITPDSANDIMFHFASITVSLISPLIAKALHFKILILGLTPWRNSPPVSQNWKENVSVMISTRPRLASWQAMCGLNLMVIVPPIWRDSTFCKLISVLQKRR